MRLYHISKDLDHNGLFIPRVPSQRMIEEDGETPRVCMSDSIEGCFSAIPDGGELMEELLEQHDRKFRLFTIDTEEVGLEESDILLPEELFENNMVVDANHTREVWVKKAFKCVDSTVIEVTSYETERRDLLPYSLLQYMEEGSTLEEAWLEYYGGDYDGVMPSIWIVKNLKYKEYMDATI